MLVREVSYHPSVAKMSENLTEPTDLTLDHSKKRIGNNAGLSILSQLEDLQHEISVLKEQHENITKSLTELHLDLHCPVLNEWSDHPTDYSQGGSISGHSSHLAHVQRK